MYLNLVEVAQSFGVSERVVAAWVRQENLPHTLDGGRLLFDRAQVAQWAAARGLAARVGHLAPESPALSSGLDLASLTRIGGIWRDVEAADLMDVLVRIVRALPRASPDVQALLEQRLRAPGGISWAPVGGGFALPHPTGRVTLGRDAGVVALLLLRNAVDPGSIRVDDVPVTRLLFFVAPSPRAHLELLGRIARMLGEGSLQRALAAGAGDEKILRAIEGAGAPGRATPGERGSA